MIEGELFALLEPCALRLGCAATKRRREREAAVETAKLVMKAAELDWRACAAIYGSNLLQFRVD